MGPRCEFGTACGLFEGRLSDLPGLAEMFRARYCDSDPNRCVRHVVAESRGVEHIPHALMPNDYEQARELIGAGAA